MLDKTTTIEKFLEAAAAKQPTPGGGSVAALAGALERGRALGVIRFNDLPSVVEAVHMLCSGLSMGASMLAKTDKETYWREIAAIVEGRFFSDRCSHARVSSVREIG